MKRGKKLFINTIVLTAASLLMRSVGLAFQVYLSQKIGAAGIGLFHLIMSVSAFAATFAISGIRFATTRLVSEELGRKSWIGVRRAVSRCLLYALCFGTAAALLLWGGAAYIGERLVGDVRSILSLRLLSLSLPFMAMGSVLSGYFTAVCRIVRSAVVQVAEQLTRISVVAVLFLFVSADNVEHACAVVVLGGIAGDVLSFLLIFLLYLFDKRRYRTDGKPTGHITRRMLGIALPLACTAYARTAISTVQNLIVPKGFKKSGASAEQALANYGMIQGMVFPVITFPAAFFSSLSELIVPELTEAQVTGKTREIETLANRLLRLCLLFSVGVMGMLLAFSDELGQAIYKNGEVGRYIKLLAALMPVMYMDTVTDGMLRGLGQHLYSMRYNILDSFLSTLFIYFLLPSYAVAGYIFVLYFSELFNFALSIHRLSRITEIRLGFYTTVKAVVAVTGAVSTAQLLLRWVGLPLAAVPGSLVLHILLACGLYALFLVLLGGTGKEDAAWMRRFLHNGENNAIR